MIDQGGRVSPDEHFMRLAIREAKRAADRGEVPAGCIIVRTDPDRPDVLGSIIAKAHNQVELLKDATAHAEMIAITQAASSLGDWRLTDTTLYVTKEPCPMCAGAIVLSRIPRVVYGVPDPRRGGAVSVFQILDHPALNHRCDVLGGVLKDECALLMQEFFKACRQRDRPVVAKPSGSPDTALPEMDA
jgi:tRNA(adenine34) deaminase